MNSTADSQAGTASVFDTETPLVRVQVGGTQEEHPERYFFV